MALVVVKAALLMFVMVTTAQAQNAPQPSGPQDEAQKTCGVAAMADYARENLALMHQETLLMPVEATIAQRRLEEQYCLRFVRCVLNDESTPQFAAAFDSCLSDEALEKYDAVPRTKD
jgi:hypothetical protein